MIYAFQYKRIKDYNQVVTIASGSSYVAHQSIPAPISQLIISARSMAWAGSVKSIDVMVVYFQFPLRGMVMIVGVSSRMPSYSLNVGVVRLRDIVVSKSRLRADFLIFNVVLPVIVNVVPS
jgi:hypothetical protein